MANIPITLANVIMQGYNNIKRHQEESSEQLNRMLHNAATDGKEPTTVTGTGLDPDLEKQFNDSAGSVLSQILIVQMQLSRRTETMCLLLQAMAAKMANMEAPETEAALKAKHI